MSEAVFNDPVHGHIHVDPLCMAIINTPQFQRLRRLKQLGATNFVFPGATHTRFEHSVGVSWLAGELLDVLKQQENLKDLISEQDELCVKIAGLCHDLGHGPFSHLFDGWFMKEVNPGSTWTHEEASVEMFKHMIQANNLGPAMAARGLTDRDIIFILEAIYGRLPDHLLPTFSITHDGAPVLDGELSVVSQSSTTDTPPVAVSFGNNTTTTDTSRTSSDGDGDGDQPGEHMRYEGYRGRPLEKCFLYEIVGNKRNSIDCDKFDYFCRDEHQLGLHVSFDYRRLIRFVRVIDVQGVPALCFRDKEKSTIYDIFHTRNSLHRRAYQHKTCNIIEHMIVEALLQANDHIRLPGTGGRRVRISDAIHDMEAYTHLTDDILVLIEFSEKPELRKAQELLQRIYSRKLYKFIDQTQPQEGAFFKPADCHRIAEGIIACIDPTEAQVKLAPDDIVIHVVTLAFSQADGGVLEHVYFWSKHVPNRPLKLRQPEIGQLLPARMKDQYIRLYSKSDDAHVKVVLANAFSRWCQTNGCLLPLGRTTDGSFTPLPSPKSKRRAEAKRGAQGRTEVQPRKLAPSDDDHDDCHQ
ncbi:SAM domain and HD domain-containing protein 1 [Salpingoeca rosetta]|uniref:SAM domain and HD domain-containing protein 1 n=1 Tax=Salpingoeca rosetta (strain ATCC 50818 / BSB-021) TaxID=946362 RepID=F2U6L8_SALR5|nr:SAM domain and HD domain-containing protein 1 [Salpingoeca rosetta]EGD83500.1 SAM domain and HD domain-containing protein 1 [Salpingoeca rosetta]|eukprot:XP_004995004.1 SAM domain and HD domain-containing protein 1 [Salpingoeca rosetta]